MLARRVSWFVLALPFVFCGCQYAYYFDISGLAKTEEGTPLPDVQITVLPSDSKDAASYGRFQSKADGHFSYEMWISDGEFTRDRNQLPKRFLRFSKDGYVDELVDISPKQVPRSFREHVPINVDVQLRKK